MLRQRKEHLEREKINVCFELSRLKNVAWNTQQQGMEVGSRDTGAVPMESLLCFILAVTNYSISADLYAHLENGAANCYEGY